MCTVEEGDELLTSALGTQCESDGAEPPDGVEPQLNILILQLVNQDRHRVEGVL